jgi:hypothetical protein
MWIAPGKPLAFLGYTFSHMRFRAKFGALGWCWAGLAGFVLVLWSSGLRTGGFGGFSVLIVLLAIQRVLLHAFVYWDVLSDGLRERRLWNTREVAWREVQHVGGWRPSQPSSDSLAIDFARPAPLSDRGSIIANPEDREEFIAALRRFAPQAAFDV